MPTSPQHPLSSAQHPVPNPHGRLWLLCVCVCVCATWQVLVSEKRNKKAANFTTAGVPYPFTNREQFERSLRAPIGKEWNTDASHKAMTAPKVTVAKGVAIAPIAEHRKAVGSRAQRGQAKRKD